MVDYDGVSRQILVKILFSNLDVPLPPDVKEILLS